MSSELEIEEKLKEIFAGLFLIDKSSINHKLSPTDVASWDSMQHLNLILAVEQAFELSITPEESLEMLNFGLIVLLIKEKLKA